MIKYTHTSNILHKITASVLRVFEGVIEKSLYNVICVLSLDNGVIESWILNLQEPTTLHITRVEARVCSQIPFPREELGDECPIARCPGWMRDGHRVKIIHIQVCGDRAGILVWLDGDWHIPKLT